MHAKKAFRPEEIDRIMQAMKSTVEVDVLALSIAATVANNRLLLMS